jgi:hypothetical protein
MIAIRIIKTNNPPYTMKPFPEVGVHLNKTNTRMPQATLAAPAIAFLSHRAQMLFNL